ncbi:uncharacterized protein [Amphiura filiformis]|uniref:uncharacterized protein n=1 Tax=Amphiura filiformis TaxID=82378 RepID=UPI003B20BCC7
MGVKKYKVPQDACICANCALQIKLGYQEPSTLYEPSKEDDSAASEEDEGTGVAEPEAQNNIQGQRLPENVPNNGCYLARYSMCEDSAVWNIAAPDWGSFSATFSLENYKEEELPHNFSLCHAHYCQHTAFKIPKCALCQKKTTILRTNGQLYMKAYKLTPTMEKFCRTNRVKMLITEATRLCTRCHQRVGQQLNNPKKLILPRMTSNANQANSGDDIQIISVKRKQTNNVKNSTKMAKMSPATSAKLTSLTKPSNSKLDVLLVCEDEALSPEQQAPFKKYEQQQKQHSADTISYYKTHSIR